jgi:UDPglucose--hexose-1-phosphate uridylyltransferase
VRQTTVESVRRHPRAFNTPPRQAKRAERILESMSPTDPVSAASGPRIHHDPLAARRVFVAPDRADRPSEADLAAGDDGAGCPFCAGNESATPPDVLRAPADRARAWQSRIVPNRYPVAVAPPPGAAALNTGGGFVRAAHGVHDVVIESAAHEHSVLAVEPAAWRDVWELCRLRLAMLGDRGDLAWATIFKNSGPAAGASLAHLHSQIVAIDFLPPALEAKMIAAERESFAALLAAASAEGRIVREQDGLVALVPHAPRQPYETWIVPRDPAPHLHAAPAGHVAALADLTRWFVARLAAVAPGADYNWWLHQWPFAGHVSARPDWHWHLEILPRLAPLAGFELGTGCHITTMMPAESARRLRGDA